MFCVEGVITAVTYRDYCTCTSLPYVFCQLKFHLDSRFESIEANRISTVPQVLVDSTTYTNYTIVDSVYIAWMSDVLPQ